MVYTETSTIVSAPSHKKLGAVVSARVTEETKMKADVLSRYAQARSVSDYLGPAVEAFVIREQKRLGLSDEQIARDWELIRREKKPRRKVSGE